MRLKDEQILTKNPDIVNRVIEDEMILLPIYRTSEEIDCIYTLNKVAAQVWDLIDGKRKLGEIRRIILERFDTTEEEADGEMAKFLKDLKGIKAIV